MPVTIELVKQSLLDNIELVNTAVEPEIEDLQRIELAVKCFQNFVETMEILQRMEGKLP